MVASLVDTALAAAVVAARDTARDAKQDRARAMDAVVDLLLERAAYRRLCRDAIPYLQYAPAREEALSDRAMMPKQIAQAMTEMLEG